jgi:hypothetical protein
VNIVGKILHTIKKNTEELLNSSKEVGSELNQEKAKYMLMLRSQKTGQRHSTKIAKRPFGDVAKCKYMGTPVTGQNCRHGEIRSR